LLLVVDQQAQQVIHHLTKVQQEEMLLPVDLVVQVDMVVLLQALQTIQYLEDSLFQLQ
jgi:hypothetical protein